MSSNGDGKYKKAFNISKETIAICNGIIEKYLKYKRLDYKRKYRDELYEELRGYLITWINSMLKKWGIFEDPGEILSLSWLAFMYCLAHYKYGYISFEKHFYEYTRYFLLHNYGKKNGVHISIDELKEILEQFPTAENMMFERLLTLYQFRDAVSERCVSIWDDALQCLDKAERKGKIDKPKYFSDPAYYSIRNSFVNIIKLVLDIPLNTEGKNKVCLK